MAENAHKKLFIKTWGCQMNVYDSRRMADILAPLGYKQTDIADDADMVILNTCHIREKATEKVFSDLGRIREMKVEKAARGEKMLIAVAGCVAQAEGDVPPAWLATDPEASPCSPTSSLTQPSAKRNTATSP